MPSRDPEPAPGAAQSPADPADRLAACNAELAAERAAERAARRRAEAALRDTEGMFDQMVDASPMGFHLYRLEGDGRLVLTGANPAADRILGLEHRAFAGREMLEVFPALAGTEIPDRYRRVCATGEPWSAEQFDYADDRVRGAFEVHAFRTAPGRIAVLFQDIAERKRAELALRDSEERYRLLVENAGDGIFIAQDGRVIFANRRAAEMAGHAGADAVAGRSMFDFIAPEDHELVRDRHLRRLGGEAVPSTYPLRMRRADGSAFWTELNAVAIEWRGRPASLNFIRDVSEQRQLEERLAAAERMRSVGTLAGGIAHDFNNILMGIQGNASLLLLDLGPASPLRPRLEEIERCVASGASLSSRILDFARGGRHQPLPTDIGALARGVLQLFARTHREIVTAAHSPEGPAVAEVDRAQIEQVLLNLYVNAWQAMPGGGEIRVDTATTSLDEAQAAAAGLPPGRYVRLSVADTGCGIEPAVAGRIFEPFFTTKDRGRGTGLGLASAYGIVQNHGGAIAVASAPGRGATFTILLPAADKPVAEVARQPAASRPGAGTVLLVDDEPVILEVGCSLLQHLGYTVLAAGGGREALDRFRASRGRIDAVILDLIMPGMGGGETFDLLRRIDPGIAVLLSSGYGVDSQAREILDRGCDGFIQKPYSVPELSEKLRCVLERRPRPRPGTAGAPDTP